MPPRMVIRQLFAFWMVTVLILYSVYMYNGNYFFNIHPGGFTYLLWTGQRVHWNYSQVQSKEETGIYLRDESGKISERQLKQNKIKPMKNRGKYDEHPTLEESEVIVITNWTTKLKGQVWLQDGDESFRSCTNLEPWMKCWYNHSVEAYNTSHAVFFRGQHVFRNDGPPTYRPKGQKWMYYETEPPTKTWGPHLDYYSDVWKAFNITMTYTSDSTIQNNVFKQRCVPNHQWKPSRVNYAKGKKRKVVWFVSNCETPSNREAYVEVLKRYIPVDVYGACGETVKCPVSLGYDCIQKLLNDNYKFYLSFENSICEEYYTEKISKTLWLKVVPIVLGAVDYSEDLPPGSFIDIRDFSSPRKLAQYLLYLDSNHTAYNSYIENKHKYLCTNQHLEHPFPCRLCHHLHTHRYKQETVEDIRTFWSAKQRCQSPREFYKGVSKAASNDENNEVVQKAFSEEF